MSSQLRNPHKQYSFRISAPGLNPVLAQKVTTPDMDLEVVKHGEGNIDIKTAGKLQIGTFNVSNLINADGTRDTWIHTWVRQVQDSVLGVGSNPAVYKRTLTVDLLDVDGFTPIRTYIMVGSWPSKVAGVELDRVGSENTTDNIEFCVDRVNVI